jgi:hypothetical protein
MAARVVDGDRERFDEAKALVQAEVGAGAAYHIVMGAGWKAGAGMSVGAKTAFVAMLRAVFAPASLDETGHSKARWENGALTGSG